MLGVSDTPVTDPVTRATQPLMATPRKIALIQMQVDEDPAKNLASALEKVDAAAREIAIIASLFEKRAQGVYHNTAVVLDSDGRTLGLYREAHIPDDPLY